MPPRFQALADEGMHQPAGIKFNSGQRSDFICENKNSASFKSFTTIGRVFCLNNSQAIQVEICWILKKTGTIT